MKNLKVIDYTVHFVAEHSHSLHGTGKQMALTVASMDYDVTKINTCYNSKDDSPWSASLECFARARLYGHKLRIFCACLR
jgi:hypothetical protein